MQVGADALVAALVAERHDLFPQLPGVGAALVPPVVQVGLVVIEDRGPVLPLAGEQLLRSLGLGELLDGPPGHAELPLDRATAVPGFQQCVDVGVPGPGAVGETMAGRPWRARGILLRRRLRIGTGGGRDKGAEAAAVLSDGPFGSLAHVVSEVPAVRDLDRLWSADGGTFGEERRPVTADHLNARPRGEPGRQAERLPVGQQVDGAAGLDVDEDGAVVAALPGRLLVNADNPWCGHLGLGKRVHQTKHRAAADGNAENTGDAGPGPARERQADRRQGRAQPFGPLTLPARQARYLLDEGTACAVRVSTGEPQDLQLKDDPSASAGNVSRKPQVGTVNLVRPGATDRARGAAGGALRVNAHYRDVHVHRQHRDVRDRREQQPLEPEQDLFHGPEHSAQLRCPGIIFRRLHPQLEGAE